MAWGSFVTSPGPAWPTLAGDTPHESLRDLIGPTTWQIQMGGTVDGVSCRSDKLDSYYRQSWQPNVEVVITNTGTTPLINPRLVVNGKRDWRTLQAMVAEATAGCTTSAERARGIWEFVRRNVFHSLAGNDFHAWQILNSYGYSFCDGQVQVLVELWQTAGLPARYSVYNSSHTTAEVFYDGAWHHMDSDEDAMILGLDNRTPAAAGDVTADHYLANRSVFYGMFAATIPYQEVSRQLNASTFTWPTGQAYPAAPQDAPSWWLLPGASMAWRWSNLGKHYSALQAGATGAGAPPSALYANGQLVYQPNLGTSAGRQGLVATTNVQSPQPGVPGLQPVDPTQPLSATWRLSVPWTMVGGQLQASVTTASANDSVSLSISRDAVSFERLAVTSAAGANQLTANLDAWLSPYTRWQSGDRTVWVRLDSAPGDGLAWTLDQLQFTVDLQMNPLSLPELTLGTNQVEYRDDTAGARQVQVAQRWIERTAWTPPQPPGLLGPLGATNANGLTFSWSAPSSPDGIKYYQLVVSEYPDMRWSLSPFFERMSTTNAWTVTQPGMLNPGQTYYWRVRASSGNGVLGPWSPTASFTVTQPAAPTGLQLQPTADGLGYILRWSPGAGGSAPVRYRVYGSNEKSFTPADGDHPVLTGGGQVATVSDYQSKSVDLNRLDTWPGNLVATTGGTSLVVAGPAAVAGANKYHWRVIAEDANGNRSTPTSFVSLPSPLLATQPAVTTIASTDTFSYQPKLVTSDGQLSMLGNAMVAYWDGMRTTWRLLAAPPGLSLDPSTGALSGTPSIGLNPVHLQATVAQNQLTNYSLPSLPVQTTTVDQQFDLRVIGPPQAITFGTLPASLTAGQTFAVTVTVTDAAQYGLSVPVTLTLEDPAGAATLAGTTTLTATNGTASFTGLSLTRAGTGYRLKATAGTATGESTAFALTPASPAPANSALVANPTSRTADGAAATTLTLTVRDPYGNPVAGVAADQLGFSASPATGVTLTQPATATDANGQTTGTARSTRAGQVTFGATVGGNALPQTTSVTFTPGPPSAAQSELAASPATVVADGSSAVTLTLTVRDAQGNPVPNVAANLLQVAASPATGVSLTQPAATNANGQATATLRSTHAATVTLSATVGGAAVPQTPSIVFTPGPVVAATSTLAADLTTITADGTSTVTLTVTLRDANGNPVPNVPASQVQLSATPSTGVVLTQPTVASDANGATTGHATSTVAATVTFSGRLGGAALGSTAAVTFVPGPANAARSIATVPASGTAGTLIALTVQARDAHDNPRTTGGDAVAASVTGANAGKPVAAKDNGDGTYTLGYTPTVAGTDSVAITLAGAALGGSPFSRTVVAGALTASTSTLAADKTTAQATGADPVTLTITARDEFSNPIPGLAANRFAVTASDATGVTLVQPSAATDATGRTTATATSVLASATPLHFSASFDNLSLPASGPVTFVPGPASAGQSTASVPAGTAGTVTAISVQLRDAHGNLRLGGGDTVAATVAGANAGKPTTVRDNANGTYTVSYTPTATGTDTLAITLGGAAISGSPFSSVVGPGPASGANATASVPASGTAGGAVSLAVQARDAYGNRLTVGGDPVTASVTGANAGKPVTAKDNGDGTYTLGYTPTVAGTDSVAITLAGAALGGSPFSRTVVAGALTAGTSTLAADKTTAQATGADPVTLTITARDEFGNPIPGLAANRFAVTVANATGVTLTQPAAATDGSGRTTASATAVTASASPAQFGASFDGQAVAQPVPVTFIAGPVSAAQSTAGVPAGIAGTATVISLQARDAHSNPRTTGGDAVAATVSGANAGTPVAVTDNHNGTYTLTYTPTVAAADSLAITLGGSAVGGSPFASPVAPAAASAARTTANVPAGAAGVATHALVQVRDAYNNSLTTGGLTVAMAVTGVNAGAAVAVTDNRDGTYTAAYTPTHAGTDSLALTLGGTAIGGSPYASTVAPAGTTAAASTATAPPGVAGAPTALTIQVRDAYGNPRTTGGDVVAVSTSGANTASPAVTDRHDGTYTASYTPSRTGTDQIVITVGGVGISGSPFASVVSPGPVSAAQSTAAVPAGTSGAATRITVQANDAQGNHRTTGGDTVAASVSGANTASLTVEDHGDGTYSTSYTPLIAGTDRVAITLGGTALGGSPFVSTVGAADTDSAASTARVPAGTAGSVTTITIQARDHQNNARSAGGDTFQVAVGGANPGTPAVKNNGDGTYTASYTPTIAGTDTVAISRGGTAISGSPFASPVTPAAASSAAKTTAVVPASVAAGTPVVVTVQARDAYGNARTVGGDAVQVVVTGANPGTPAVTDAGNGTYTAGYTPTKAGADQLAVTLGGTSIAGSPFACAVSAAGSSSAQQSAVALPASVPDGTAVDLVVTVRDAYGNARLVGGDTVTVAVTGANPATPAVTDRGDGTYAASYVPKTPGTDHLAITLNGTALPGPYSVAVVLGTVAPSHSTAAVPGGTAGSATTLTVTARDANDNALASGGSTVAASVTGANAGRTVSVVDRGDGTYQVSYTPTVAGTDTIAVTLDGVAIAGSPFSSLVVPGPSAAAKSTVTVPAGLAGAVTELVIQARDAYGNARPAGGDAFQVSVSGANTATPKVTDHGDGTYAASYTPSKAGTDQIALTLNGTAVDGSPFTSAVSSAATSSAEQSTATVPATVTAGTPVSVTVVAHDAFGNLRATGGDAVVVTVTGGNASTPAVKDNGDGTYLASYTPTVAGSDAVAITLGGTAIGGSPYASTVTPGPADPAHCTADVPAGRAGEATALAVKVRDAYGNLRTAGGDAVAVAVSGANTASPAITDLKDGGYAASYTPAAAGTDQVVVTVGGTAIAGSPFSSTVAPGAVDASKSTFSADRASAPADGSRPVTLSLVLQDAFGNPIPGVQPNELTITADPSDGTSLTAPGAASDAAGAMAASVAGTKPQTVTLSATARGVKLAATVSVRFRPHLVVTLPAGKQLVGLAFTPDDPTPEAVLGQGQANVRRWQPALQDYVRHQPGDADPDGFVNFGPGRGLWLAPAAPVKLDLLGEPAPTGPFTLTVPRGWSNLANPFDHDLPWTLDQITVLVNGQPLGTLADAKLWDTVRPYLWVYNPAQDKVEPVFPPYTQPAIARFAGFWAYALADGVQLAVNAPAASRARASASGPRDWQLQLTAQQGDLAPAVALVGAAAALSRAMPVEAPPDVSAGPLRLEVLQPSGGRAAGELRPGADGTWSWDLVVSVPQDGQVTLAWPSLLRSLPRGLTASLQDLTSGTTCLLNTHGSYRFAGTRGERRMKLVCRFGHYDRAEITSFSAVQGRGRGLSVNLALSGPAEVTLRVRGLGGRLVKELTSSGDVAGALTVSWDGTDQTGRPAPAGTYQLEATAVSADGALSRAVRTVVIR